LTQEERASKGKKWVVLRETGKNQRRSHGSSFIQTPRRAELKEEPTMQENSPALRMQKETETKLKIVHGSPQIAVRSAPAH